MIPRLIIAIAAVSFCIEAQASTDEPAWTSIQVDEMHCDGCARKIAARLYAVRGVKEVRVNMETKTLFVAPQLNAVLSPQAMWEAVESANDVPIRLAGPNGTFTEKPRL